MLKLIFLQVFSHGDVLTDIGHYISIVVATGLIRPLLVLGGLWIAAQLMPLVENGLWPHHWPFVIQLIWVMVVLEAVTYWVHRLQHRVPVLWRFHCIHHSAHRLYWLNTVRFHFVDILMNAIPGFGLLIVLGVNEEVLMAGLLVTAVIGLFQHGNLKTRIGWLNWIFSMAELHRWHHSNIAAESNSNYGQSIILWDIVFGTRFLPEDREQPAIIGMNFPAHFPDKFLPQLLAPVMWKQYESQSSDKNI